MTTSTDIKQWGNSAGIRISKRLLKENDLKIGDTLNITISHSGSIILNKSTKKTPDEVFKPLVNTKGWKFDREEANER